MKVIALEEHFADKDLNPACSEAIMKLSPWYSKTMSPGLPYFFDFKMFADTSDKRIADMDEHGITMQVLSCPTETGLVEGEKAIPLVRQANDRLADAVSAHPDRFAGMANLPLSDPEAAAEELGRVVRDLHMSSAVLAGRPQKDARFLDDPAYEPVLAEAEELDVPIYIHPGTPLPAVQDAYYARLDPVVSARLSVFGWGWHNEAGIQAIRMILSGVFERHPKLQIITGHWGELVPYYLARLDQALPPECTHLSEPISEVYKKHFYITPSGIFSNPHVNFTRDVLGLDRLLFSVDFPMVPNDDAVSYLEGAPLSDEEREDVSWRNAAKLLKLNV